MVSTGFLGPCHAFARGAHVERGAGIVVRVTSLAVVWFVTAAGFVVTAIRGADIAVVAVDDCSRALARCAAVFVGAGIAVVAGACGCSWKLATELGITGIRCARLGIAAGQSAR